MIIIEKHGYKLSALMLFVTVIIITFIGLTDFSPKQEEKSLPRLKVMVNKLDRIDNQIISSELPNQDLLEIEAPTPIPEGYTNRWGITYISDEERNLLARVLYLEGHNTGLEGCQKIAVVVFNRVNKKGKTITEILSAPGQFSVYRAATNPESPATEQEYLAIESVLTGNVSAEIYNAPWLYFNGNGHQNFFS